MTGSLEGGSGADALAGLNYQIDVSIWLALDLVLARRLTDSVELEPASEEDLEADLAPEEPGPVVSGAAMTAAGKPYKLVIQAKLRSGDPWNVADLNRLLEHGTHRISAAVRLRDPMVRYMLVTSAAVTGEAKALRTHSATVWPTRPFPKTTANLLPKDAIGRVAIIANFEPDLVEIRIKEILTEALRVPMAQWKECLKSLRSGASSRVRRKDTNLWTRADLERVIVQHEGYLTSSPELDDYVRPTNWEKLRSQIARDHAVLIIGQSGTGKTLTSAMLFGELADEIPGLRRVVVRTPEEIRRYSAPGPVLFDIEDPWGRYSFEEAGRPWIDQLHGIMASARADQLVVVTSRLDVGRDTTALSKLGGWLFPLEAEHYGDRERRQLYGRRIDRLKLTSLKQLASKYIKPVLEELRTPLEIQKFFDALRLTDPTSAKKNPGQVIANSISVAHENSIEATLAQQIAARNDERAAVVLWGLLLDRQTFAFEDLAIIEDTFYRLDESREPGISPLANFLVAARNLRQKDNLLSIYHARDEVGLKKAIIERPLPVRASLGRLVEILATTQLNDGELHVERAAVIVDACKSEVALRLTLSLKAQSAIDQWLNAVMAIPGRDLERQLRLAASIGSETSTEGEIARWLLHRPNKRDLSFMMHWGPKRLAKGKLHMLRAAPETRALIVRFIREELAFARDYYDLDFVRWARLLAGDVTDAFIAGAHGAVHYGVLRSEGTVFRGAFADLDGCAGILDEAISVNTATTADEEQWNAQKLAMDNGEFSPGYIESLGDDDSGFTAREFLEAYATEYREQRGWQALATHSRVEALKPYWLRSLRRSKNPVPSDELIALQKLVVGDEQEDDFWSIAMLHWSDALLPLLAARVESGSDYKAGRVAAMLCLLSRGPDALRTIITSLASGAEGRLADIAIEIATAQSRIVSANISDKSSFLILPSPYREIAEFDAALDATQPVQVSPAIASAIARLPAESEAFRHFRIRLAANGGEGVHADVKWILSETMTVEFAVDAVNLAIGLRWNDIVEGALDHRFADVAAAALRALAPPCGPLPVRLIALIAKKGRPIRQALVDLLGSRPSAEHLEPLLALAEDRLSNSDTHDDDNSLPIARAAIEALHNFSFDDAVSGDLLMKIAAATDDTLLRERILGLLAARAATYQAMILGLVVSKEKPGARIAAARALVTAQAHLQPAIVATISNGMILRQPARLAADLVLLLGWRGTVEQVDVAAAALSASPKRRVFLALLAAARLNSNAKQASEVANHLPDDHPAKLWSLGQSIDYNDDQFLNDLGSVDAVAEVLPYLAHRNSPADG